jgi:beta-phosphoglucomutase
VIDSASCGSENPTCATVLPGGNGPVIVSMSPFALAFCDEPCIIDAPAAPVGNMEFILDGLDLRRFFDAITTADDIENGKPDPEIFLRSAEKVGVEPQNCLVFEDAVGGFEAAHRAGMKSIGIATVNSIEDILKLDSVVEAHLDFSGLHAQELIERYVPLQAEAN